MKETRKPDWTKVAELLQAASRGLPADSGAAVMLGGAIESAQNLAGGAETPSAEVMRTVVSGVRRAAQDGGIALPAGYALILEHILNPEKPLPDSLGGAEEPSREEGDLHKPLEGEPVTLTFA